MKKTKIAWMLVMVLIFCSFSISAEACEKHNLSKSESTLPGDSLYHIDSTWINQRGESVTLASLAERPRLVAMVYTKCQTACPLLIREIKTIVSQISPHQNQELSIDLFSFDSETENINSLQNLKSKYKLSDNWSAYFGSAQSVSELAAALGVQFKKLPAGEYIHSNVIFLLNKKGEVIAQHEGLNRDTSEFVKKIQSTVKTN